MISYIQALRSGNAVQVFVVAPETAIKWRVLRRLDDLFTGEDDVEAVLVDESDDRAIIDVEGLVNGTVYYYKAYYFDGSVWTTSSSVTVTPNAIYQGDEIDVLSILRSRLALGLSVEVARGVLKPKSGSIKVMNAPPRFEDTTFPVVSVHLDSDSASEWATGSNLYFDEDAESESWLARWQISIIGWSLNPDERIALRRAIKRIIAANYVIFSSKYGMVQIDFDQNDLEDMERYSAPVYQVATRFSCMAPAYVVDMPDAVGLIAEVDTVATAIE